MSECGRTLLNEEGHVGIVQGAGGDPILRCIHERLQRPSQQPRKGSALASSYTRSRWNGQ